MSICQGSPDPAYVGCFASKPDGTFYQPSETCSAEPPTCSPTPATMTFNSNGPDAFPAACWRPFLNDGNPFNQPIPDTAKTNHVDATKSSRLQTVLTQWGNPQEILGRLDGHAGEPTYYAQVTDPTYTIKCANDFEGGALDGSCPVNDQPVHIPKWAMPEGGKLIADITRGVARPDAHLTVIDPPSANPRYEWDIWQVQAPQQSPQPTTLPQTDGVITVSYANRIPLTNNGLHNARAGTAAWFANTLGRIRVEELEAGQINHALMMDIPCHNDFDGPARLAASTERRGVVFPAAAKGRWCSTPPEKPGDVDYRPYAPNAPAMGAHIFYDLTAAQIDALRRPSDNSPLPAWKRTILKALNQYGAFVGDTAGSWGFEVESGYQYYSTPSGVRRWYDTGRNLGWRLYWGEDGVEGTGDDRYLGRLQERVFPDNHATDEDATVINFAAHLKVLDPCVSQKTCSSP
ncbi:hypothetical protein FGE12_14395 [Aggregicoccus sp. 17bor-14]|uniref:hypothetical protein n=1 Tax=Myxococcaceae TaxID=31 RepID=UPI00129C730A|nr:MULTISPECIES: hypothetical protein [Myxococcaceae]MBF5043583.1 hypothetical protein [Simulacricoccus sp. 17bor-14]MRI89342.1 hypothetical protein [Aggregicoccus sp. 17bor-14]